MALTDVGSYVLCKEPGSDGPPWPGVVYAGDPIPRHVRETQPKGLVTLVLLFTEPYTFYWAKTTWLSPLVPLKDGDYSVNSEALQQAYGTAAFMMEAQMGMEQYQELVEDQFGNDGSAHPMPEDIWEDEPEVEEEVREDESEVDEELHEALRISLNESQSSTSRSLPSPSNSPPERFRRGSSTPTLADEDSPTVYVRPRAQRGSRASPERPKASRSYERGVRGSPILIDNDLPTRKRRRISTPDVERSNGLSVREGKQPQKRFSLGSNADQLLDLNNLGQSSAAPASDVVEEEDLSQSKAFVQVHVGPQEELFNLQKKHVWNRNYFRDATAGINYFRLNAGTWELDYPKLRLIEVADFQYVAEYLTDDAFGIRDLPDTEEEVSLACAQCISAWDTADKLGFNDMLEHIADKVHYLAWDRTDLFPLAVILYRSEGPLLDAHELMRDWTSGYLAQHFWEYNNDPEYAPFFWEHIKELPELHCDLMAKLGEILKKGVEMKEEKEEEEDDR